MTTDPAPPIAAGRRPGVLVAAVVGAVSVVLLSSCSSPASKAGQGAAASSTTTPAHVAACPASSVSAAVDYTTIGGTSTAPVGAVLFSDTSSTPCALRGIPTVQLVGADGQVIPSFEAPSAPAHEVTAVLTPGGMPAASSITWSSLTCFHGSYSLSVEFPGWSGPVPAGSTAGYSGSPCTAPGTTVYVSPVEPVTAPPANPTTTTTGG